MSGRRGGRIGVDRYPRLSAAQGVWRLNEAHFEARFNSWPVVFYPGFVTPFPQDGVRMTTIESMWSFQDLVKVIPNGFFDIVTPTGREFTYKGLTVFSATNDFFDLFARPGQEFTSKGLTVFSQTNEFVDYIEKPGKSFTFKALPIFLDNTGAVS